MIKKIFTTIISFIKNIESIIFIIASIVIYKEIKFYELSGIEYLFIFIVKYSLILFFIYISILLFIDKKNNSA